MKPWEETWRVGDVGDEQTIFGQYGGQAVAEFEIDGDWDDTSEDQDDYAYSAQRTRLAAAAPEMARLLLEVQHTRCQGDWCGGCPICGWLKGDCGQDHKDDCRLLAVLRKAGVIADKEQR